MKFGRHLDSTAEMPVKYQIDISRLRDFTGFGGNASYRLLNKGLAEYRSAFSLTQINCTRDNCRSYIVNCIRMKRLWYICLFVPQLWHWFNYNAVEIEAWMSDYIRKKKNCGLLFNASIWHYLIVIAWCKKTKLEKYDNRGRSWIAD